MNKELLDEFLVKLYYVDNTPECLYSVCPSDKAYELLNLKKGDRIDEKYYNMASLKFLSEYFYRIDGLVRHSCGNYHDGTYETEVIIFNNGGDWSKELNYFRTIEEEEESYSIPPNIIDKEKITDEIIENWSQSYDLSYSGEGGRYVLCSNDLGSFCFSLKRDLDFCRWIGSAATSKNIYQDFSKYQNYNDKKIIPPKFPEFQEMFLELNSFKSISDIQEGITKSYEEFDIYDPLL